LNVNKRLKLDKDKEKLNNVKQDILNEDIPIYKTIYKYFKMTNEPSEYNISYRNEIARDVSKTKRQLLNKKNEYEIGEKLMCIEYIKTNGFIMLKNGTTTKPIICKCNKNCSYEIAEITKDTMTIKDIIKTCVKTSSLDGLEYKYANLKDRGNYTLISYEVFINLPINTVIRPKFMHNYCRTGDSIQGITIDNDNCNITIYDWGFYYVTREWIWTALTRSTNLNNVYFHKGNLEEFDHNRLRTYLKKKIDGYVEQDKNANREISKDNYITVDWLSNAIGKRCSRCQDILSYEVSSFYNVRCNLTADRIDNDIGHELDNIKPMCVQCNTAKSNN
jgi:hypothetical protein